LFSPTRSNRRTLVCKHLGRNVTNNSAEYLALIYGLKTALRLGVRHIQVYGDSQLVVHQVICQNGGQHFPHC
jgi:ribonuclease HI